MKKIISVILCTLLIAAIMIPVLTASAKQVNYLLLGDSITEGFGVANPDEASYGKIIADTNGWNYTNRSRMARQSKTLLNLLENSYYVYSAVEQADIISLSIGANDYLANDEVVGLVAGALFGLNNKKLDAIQDEYRITLNAIMDRIFELNPDATVLIQTYYNAWRGFANKTFAAGADRVNAVIVEYAEAHPDRVTLCDISSVMEGHPEYLADDCVHPNALGNIAVAEVVLKQMHDMGLCEATEPTVESVGINYNYFVDYIDKTFGKLITFLVKLLTGNAVNIIR